MDGVTLPGAIRGAPPLRLELYSDMLLAAGGVALVKAIKGGKVRRAEAIKIARKLKIPKPEEAPRYIVKTLRMTKAKRAAELRRLRRKLQKQLKRGKGWWESAANQKRDVAELRWRIAVVETLMGAVGQKVPGGRRATGRRPAAGRPGFYRAQPVQVQMPQARQVGLRMPQASAVSVVPDAELEAQEKAIDTVESAAAAEVEEKGGMPTWGWIALGAAGIGIVVLLMSKKGKHKGEKH